MFERIKLLFAVPILVSAFVLQPAFSADKTAFVSGPSVVTKVNFFMLKGSEFNKSEKELTEYVASCNKQYEAKKAANATQDELKAFQETLQAEITAKTTAIQSRAKETEAQMVACIKEAVKACCELEGLDSNSARISTAQGEQPKAGEVDLTEKVTARLNATKPETKLVSPVPIMPKLAPQ